MVNAQDILAKAKRYGVCSMLTGEETTEQLMKLVFTPQGVEFCTKFKFPDLNTLRQYKGEQAQSSGIYVDTDVELDDPEDVLIAGDAVARLNYKDYSMSHHVIAMHGAKVVIKASGYVAVFVKNAGAELEVIKLDNAIVDVR